MIRSDSRGLTLTFQLVCTLVATVPSEWHSWSGASKITGNFSAHVRNSTTRLYDELDNPEDTAFDLYNSDYGLLRRSDPYAVLSHGVSGSWKNNKGCAYFFKLTFIDSQRERDTHTCALAYAFFLSVFLLTGHNFHRFIVWGHPLPHVRSSCRYWDGGI